MVMKELLRCDEETQKTFLKEVSLTEYIVPWIWVVGFIALTAEHVQHALAITF